jgi:mannose-1-phosphate guanylyltransferase
MARKTPRHVAILAGGSGTRFWPAGTASKPKQLLALDGDDPRSLLRATYDRVAPLCDADGPWIVAAKALAPAIKKVLPAKARGRLILEPVPRNTAAAIALAAHVVQDAEDAWTIDGPALAFVPADARVRPQGRYVLALAGMLDQADSIDGIVLLGVRPTFPATGYGYVEIGPLLGKGKAGALHEVKRFVEKPSRIVAQRYVRGRRHVWNLGTFAASTGVFLRAAFECFAPLHSAIDPAFHPRFSPTRLAARYAKIPSVSFDHAVLEKMHPSHLEVVVTNLDWDDLGSWDAVARHAIPAGSEAIDAKNCCVRVEDGTVVALLGVDDLVVVRTAKATLVAKKGRGEDVRKVVERLKAAGRGDVVS